MKTIESVKQEILQGLLRLTAAIGLIALIPSLWACAKTGVWPLFVFDCLIYIWILGVAFLPFVGYSLRLFSVIAIGLGLGTAVMAFTGADGAGYVWLTCSVLVAALLGRKTLIIATFGATMAIMFLYAGASALSLVPHPQAPAAVIVIASNLLIVFSVLVLVIRRLLAGLEAELEESRMAATALELELGRNEGLLKELNHRVRNNMQLSLSIVAMEAARGRGNREEGLAAVERRLWALAVINDLLVDDASLESIELRKLVHLLSNSEPRPAAPAQGEAWVVGDFSLRLATGEASVVGIAVSEIAHILRGRGGGRIDLEGPGLLFRVAPPDRGGSSLAGEEATEIKTRLEEALKPFLPAASLSLAPSSQDLGMGIRLSLDKPPI